jgi:phosphoesterase RecJ-like protein
MVSLIDLKKKLAQRQKIVITTHYKPDGDALGSSLALYHWLAKYGHEVALIVPSDYPSFLFWMPGQEEAIIYTSHKEKSDKLIEEADIIFCLDFNHLSRILPMEDVVRKSTALKVMIDHHIAPEGFDDARLWDCKAAATAQLVYEFIVNHMDDRKGISADIAASLYTGIMTDTGSFRFPSTTAEVHLIIADLITLGAQNWKIHENVFNSSTESRLRFLGFCLLNRLEVIPEYNTAIFAIKAEDLKQFDITTGDTEGLVNYALSVSGIRLAALIIDRTERIKLSLRSIGDIPCNEICSRYFEGGGHKNAAGGQSKQPLPEVVQTFKSILPEYKNLLTT